MISKIDRKATRERRHLRVRTKISGTAEITGDTGIYNIGFV